MIYMKYKERKKSNDVTIRQLINILYINVYVYVR